MRVRITALKLGGFHRFLKDLIDFIEIRHVFYKPIDGKALFAYVNPAIAFFTVISNRGVNHLLPGWGD